MNNISEQEGKKSIFIPERKSKLISLTEAGKIIADCKTLHLGGGTIVDGPMALIREAIRAGAKDLTVIPPVASGIATDLLIAAGCVKKLYVSFINFEFLGFAPAFKKAGETNSIDIIEADEPFLVLGTRAAAMNLPFIPVKNVYEATDLPKLNPLLGHVIDPYTGEDVMTIPPLKSDICIIHAELADERGNAQCWGGNQQEWDMAMSADKVIISAEQIVTVHKTRENPSKTTVPGHMVDAVVHIPYGAHPTAAAGFYHFDTEHMRLYMDHVSSGKSDEYLSRFVLEPKDHYEYLERIGLRSILNLPTTW